MRLVGIFGSLLRWRVIDRPLHHLHALKVSANSNKSKEAVGHYAVEQCKPATRSSSSSTAAAGRRASPSKAARASPRRWPPSLAPRAPLGNAADDEADAGRRRKKRPKQDVGPLPDDAANLLREYCRRENKDVAFAGGWHGPFVSSVTVNGATHSGEARASKKAARESAADAFFQALVSVDQNSQHVVVQRWRERCSTDVVDMIGRLGSSTDVPWRRPVAAHAIGEDLHTGCWPEKDRFVAIRDHPARQRERCETDVASQADRRGWRGLVVSGRGQLGGGVPGGARAHTTAKFADVLDDVAGIVVCAATRTASACASRWTVAATTCSKSSR